MRDNSRSIAFCLLVLLFIWPLALVRGEDKPLLFLGNQNLAPVVYKKDGQPTGLAVDLVRELGKRLGRPITIICMDWAEAQEMVARGEADALIQINWTAAREAIYDFSDPLLQSQFSIFTLSNRPGITGASGLRGLRVGVEKGGLPHTVLQEDALIRLVLIPDFLEGFKMVNKGELDAVVVDYRVGAYLLAENQIPNIRISGEPIAFSQSAIAVREGNKELLAAINRGLKEIRRDGTYANILSKWEPKEVVFMTREQIEHLNYLLAIGILSVFCAAATVWMITLYHGLKKRKQAEEALRREKTLLRCIIDSATDLIFIKGVDGAYLGCNKASESFVGLAESQQIGKTDFDFFDREKAEEIRAADRQVMDDGKVVRIEERMTYPDGHAVLLDTQKVPYYGADGKVSGLVGISRDITERKRSEEACRASEERFRLVFENSPVSIWEEDFSGVRGIFDTLRQEGVADLEACFAQHPEMVRECAEAAKIVAVNRAALTLHGATSKDELLNGLADTFTPASYETFRKELLCLWRGETWMSCDAVVKTLAGERRDVTVYFSLCPGYEQTFAKVLVSLVDITERKRAEDALREGEESLRKREAQLNESQRVGQIGSWDWDAVNDAIWWSDEYYRIYGLDPAQPTPNYEEHLLAYTPESAGRLDALVKRAMETGEPYEADLELATPTETTHWVAARGEVKRDASGNISGLRGTAQNITERKRIDESLLNLAAIVEFSDDAIISKSLEGVIESWNRGAERLYGYRKEEVIGRSISLLLPADHGGEIASILAQIKRGVAVEHQETVRVCKDGRRIDVSVIVSPICDATGRIVGASTIARDISERKKNEAELRKLYEEQERRVSERTADLNRRSSELADSQRALMNIVEDLNMKTLELEQVNAKLQELDRLKSMFIASMSHELRTPLNSIIGFSSVILNEWLGPVNAEQKENLAIILRSGKHLLNLINDVIDVSKIEAGKIESAVEAFDLHDLVNEAVTLVKKDLEEKGLDLQVEAAHQPMLTDRRRLLQCLLNLLSNAVKFTERGGVTVATRFIRVEGDPAAVAVAEICVTDTGIGIREEDLPKMFNPFVRLVPSGQAIVPGTGLGLYLSRKLAAEVLKGDILLSSEYGTGSRFTISLPVRLS
jgi:PAS domain S-box-containing protein